MERSWSSSAWARRPGIAIGVAHLLGEPGRDPRAPHRRRGGGRRAQRFEKALLETDAQLARIQAADRRARGRRAAVPHPRGAPADAVRRAPGRGGAPHDPRGQDRRRVGGAQGAGPDPGGVRAHRGSRTSATAGATSPWSASACCATWSGIGDSASPEEAPRGASWSRTSCRPPTSPSWGARRSPASSPRGAGAPRTRRSWRARWGCRTWCGVEALEHKVWSGMTLVVDGARGEVILDPDAEALQPLRGARRGAAGRARSGWRRSATCRARPATAPRCTCPPTSRCWRRSRSPSSWAPSRWGCSAPSSSTSSAPTCRPRTSSTRTPSPR